MMFCSLVLLACAGVTGYLAAFHWWAAGGPPVSDTAGHEWLGNIFAALSAVTFSLSMLCVVVARRKAGKST